MILLDTNVVIYAGEPASEFHPWARALIADAVTGERLPLPDFFIGAHAEIMDWSVATADPDRFKTYFPSVTLRTPKRK